MTKSLLVGLFLGLGGAAVATFCAVRAEDKPAAAVADAKDKPAAEKQAKEEVFGLTRLHEFHLELTAKEWETMQQVVGGMRFGPPGPAGPPKPLEKPGEEPVERHKNAGFGTEFPWAHGAISEGGTTWKNVGTRYKGNASYTASSRGLKRNFKIDLDHYDPDLRYHGLKTINLNAGAMDPTRARETLSFAVFRAAGVPAPRTAFAEVKLTVPGKYDQELLGLYTFVEQVDKTFLKDRFGNNKGLLMKPERLRGLEYLGEDWERYKDRYQPKHEPTKEEARRVIAFTKLLNRGDDEQFKKEIDSYLDIDGFLRYVAVNALLSNLDSFLMLGHNYYIYLNPTTNKLVFLPWDTDLSLAGFPMGGGAEQQADLSITHPYPGENKLIDRLLAIPEVKEKYLKLLKELSETCFAKAKLLKDLDAIEKVTREPLAREKKAAAGRKEGGGFGPGGPGGPFGRSLDLRTFVEKRTESVAAQLAGKSKGFTPAAFGPGGPGGRPGGPGGRFGPGQMLAPAVLKAADTNADQKMSQDEVKSAVKRLFQELDKDKKGTLDEKALAAGINRLMPPPPGFGGGPAPVPVGFGPGNHFAAVVMKAADADKDGKLTPEELLAAAEKWFKETDKDKTGQLDEKLIIEGINRLLGPPPGGAFVPAPPPGGAVPPPPPGKEEGR